MLQYGNILILTFRFFNVAKFTALIPLSLLISYELSFLIIHLKIYSVPIFALKSLKKLSFGRSGLDQIHVLVPCKRYPSYGHFYPQLVYAHTEL
jgi:hypothetical protein